MTVASSVVDEPVTVLVVDDSADHRLLLRRFFEKSGCRVLDAESAEEAIALYRGRQGDLDLAVVDLLLPGMSGWDLTTRIRDDLPGCPIAITSVLGVDEYPQVEAALPKPVSRAQVRGVLGRCVRRWVTP